MTYVFAHGIVDGREVRFASRVRPYIVPHVPALALLRTGLRLAIAATLSLTVLLVGSGVHPTSHCEEHAVAAVHADAGVADDAGEPDGDDADSWCLSCDCSCQSLHPCTAPVLMMTDARVVGCVHASGSSAPDEIFLEPEPPPVRAS